MFAIILVEKSTSNLPCFILPFSLPLSVIDKLGAKELVMGLVNHGNTEVRMQALLSIQKMMVQNW